MVKKFLGKHSGTLYGIMRIVVGFLFLCHGLQKLFGVLGGNQVEIASQMGLAGIIELVGGGLICIGLFASSAAFISSGLMAAAYFIAHAGQALLPIQNRGELAVLYCFVFLYIAAVGNGKLSLAKAINKPDWD